MESNIFENIVEGVLDFSANNSFINLKENKYSIRQDLFSENYLIRIEGSSNSFQMIGNHFSFTQFSVKPFFLNTVLFFLGINNTMEIAFNNFEGESMPSVIEVTLIDSHLKFRNTDFRKDKTSFRNELLQIKNSEIPKATKISVVEISNLKMILRRSFFLRNVFLFEGSLSFDLFFQETNVYISLDFRNSLFLITK